MKIGDIKTYKDNTYIVVGWFFGHKGRSGWIVRIDGEDTEFVVDMKWWDGI